jgi:predicted  nucleic acid-binding Zn-ribbon protein
MAKETLEFELKADTKTAEKQVKKFEDDIKGFKSRIEDEEALELSLNVGKIQSQLDRVKQELKDVEDEEVKIELLAERARLKQELTQATRELRNYARTGKKDVSVLGKLFQNVSGDIDKTRLEILKLGKSTKVLDKMEKDLDSINREFQEGKINAQQYGVQLNKIQSNIKNSNKSFFSLKKTLAGVSGFLIAGL